MTPSPTAGASTTAQWPEHVGLLAVICFFCAPLLAGLSDFDTDEAIYSHAVDRILDSGDRLHRA
jgi:hypothetical protein